jgi:ketosteroid isomerase-like protein
LKEYWADFDNDGGEGMPRLTEEEFRDLEEKERRAVLAGDAVAIGSFWAPELLVNGPHNRLLVGIDSTLDMVRSGTIDFERFDRVVERVEIDGDIAVSMGSETIVQRRGPQAGQLINRRYTNVWRHSKGGWRLRFRHANVVPTQGQILDQAR